jgi:prevent-host-death family protein
MENIIGLKQLRENTENYISEVKKGRSFIVARKSKPLFKITPISEDNEPWETVVDFTKIKKGGLKIRDLLSRL